MIKFIRITEKYIFDEKKNSFALVTCKINKRTLWKGLKEMKTLSEGGFVYSSRDIGFNKSLAGEM